MTRGGSGNGARTRIGEKVLTKLLAIADKLLAGAVVVLGAGQCLATFVFFKKFEEPAAWWFAGGMLLVLTGALSLLRIGYGAVAPGVARTSLAANAALAVFWVALYWGLFEKFARRPASFVGLFVIVAAAVVSLLRASLRRRAAGLPRRPDESSKR